MSVDQRGWVEDVARQHGRMIFTTAYRMLGNEHDAEDVLQDVMVALLNGKVKGRAIRDWGAFLRVMASRRAIDVLRRSSKHDRNVPLRSDPADPSERGTRNEAAQRRKAALLRSALGRLGEREGQVFSLRYFEELSYERIAGELGMSVSQVGVILHRARKRLQEILDPTLGSGVNKEAGDGRA